MSIRATRWFSRSVFSVFGKTYGKAVVLLAARSCEGHDHVAFL